MFQKRSPSSNQVKRCEIMSSKLTPEGSETEHLVFNDHERKPRLHREASFESRS